MALVVGVEAAQVAKRKRAAAFSSVERSVFQGEQTLGALEEVGIFASLAQLVLSFDGLLRLVNINAGNI